MMKYRLKRGYYEHFSHDYIQDATGKPLIIYPATPANQILIKHTYAHLHCKLNTPPIAKKWHQWVHQDLVQYQEFLLE